VGIEGGHDICFDPVFKAVFTRDTSDSKGALAALISAIIGKKVTIVKIVANEPPVDNKKDRQIRYDIQCKIDGGELVNIEMTIYPGSFEPVRLEFHAAKLFSGQDIKGKKRNFGNLKSAYQISFLVKRSFFKDKKILHSFEYYDRKNKVSLGGRSRIFTIELKKLDKIVQKPIMEMSSVERWAVFFRYLTNKAKRDIINEILEVERGIEMAGKTLLTVSRDERERARMMSEYKYITDHQSNLVEAEQKGEKRGWDKCKVEDRKEFLSQLKSGKSIEELIKMYS